MKKSKIIAPALGVLILSTAAAVTGTVAWFTANRTVSIQNTAITAFNPEEGLKVTLSGASGCTIGTSVGSGSTAAAVSHDLLRDASVDLTQASPVVYRAVVEEDTSISAYAVVADPTAAAGQTASSDNYYYCSIYTATFELDQGASGDTYNLKIDPTKMVATGSSTISAALRIGIRVSNSVYKVITPFAQEGTKTYVNGTGYGTNDTSTYSTIGSNSDASDAYQLGTLSADGTVVATVYTWFEGTDAACVNNNVDGEQLSVTLGFSVTKAA